MTRNLVICCDGTNNQFGPENTSVVRLVQVLDRGSATQRLYYDPGVGTLPEPGVWSAAGKRLSEVFGLAFGGGITWKVGEAYSYLMDFWEPGDRVFLFGFSRGAYTVRVLAGLLHALGLLPRGNHNLVPYVLRLFSSLRKYSDDEHARGAKAFWKLCNEFRWTFARAVPGDNDDRRFRVHFMGLWDTVSSVGWVWDPARFPFTTRNPSVAIVRHAIAIDERRWFFRQNLMQPAPEQDIEQVWFAGVHGDVGGGYPEADSGLWRIPFTWMLDEAIRAGLEVDASRTAKVLRASDASATPWTEPQHESLTARWWPAEFFPKLQWQAADGRRRLAIGRGRHRFIPDGSVLHESVLLRLRDVPSYRPPNLSEAFQERVRGLSAAPGDAPYAP